MPSGRSIILLGRRMVINLNNKGGVRKSPGSNARAKCMRYHIKGKGFLGASSECKGVKGVNWSP